jgi:hypothetical protein
MINLLRDLFAVLGFCAFFVITVALVWLGCFGKYKNINNDLDD